MGADDVVLGELQGVAEGVVDEGLRGEVHDGVDALAEEEVEDEVTAEARSPRTKRKLG